ncbi:siphovirus ReqiPepy6 Gp37-like family protein [Verrucosispora sp. NA02020]|uniref:siphovirus ReqiPepy6 Gp37-like family protein n=1 Tax=Verrucosispora sp. NA02020 TaxID=2742132 RepID=UPI001591E619|nr:siphovirus ReqiPepy6 Gp37-like family protein [Verrucosispora sp. NA02020]QKW15387.1 siphovirus ReqiPepy6 Gp37-like family protein [Verrucosispora sp. NA02020]
MGVHGPAPVEAQYTIWISDHNLAPISQQVDDWSSISLTLRFNEVSSGEFTAPAHPELVAAARTPMARVVVERNGEILLAGPIEYTPLKYDAETHGYDGHGDITVRWADDLALIAGRISYPNPTLAATAQDVAKWTQTGTPEVLMRALVDSNGGPGALSDRRIPCLVLGASAGITGSVTWSTRFQPVTDDLRGIAAIAPTRVGFRTQQVDGDIEFQVFTPTDRTGSIWFSRSMGNLVSLDHEPEAPKTTVGIGGGKDAGVNRLIIERGTPGDWWRLETFVDGAGADNLTELQAMTDEEIANNAEVQRLAVVAADVDGQRFGDYQLGDVVAVEAAPGQPDVPDIVSAVEIEVDPGDGETIRPIIGVNSAQMLNPAAAVQRDILRALSRRGAFVEIPL